MIDYPAHLEAMWQKAIAPRGPDAPTVISTFAGGGGSLTGYMMAGYRDLLAVEWDKNACDTLRLNWPELDIYEGDIANLSVAEVLRRTGLESGELDILDGSPPCQGFSTAGKRQLSDARNQLFNEFVRLLRGLRPKVFIMENVSGMIKGKMKIVFAEVMRELKASGYRVSTRLLNAMYFHVPQSRQRLIFIGVRDDLGIAPSHPGGESSRITVGEAFNGVRNMTYDRALANTATAIWNYVRPGENGSQYRKGYYRDAVKLSPTKVSPPVLKVIPGTGGHMHWGECRTVSIEELKRLGTFPDGYILPGKFRQQWERIGNSVPPLFMEAIARHVKIEILNKIKLESHRDLVTIKK